LKLLSYLRYFFYLGFNWNWRIAFTIIAQEIKGEKEYDIDTTGADELKSLSKKGIDTSHATMYMPISYLLIENIFNNITGVDFSQDLCEDAIANLQRTKEKFSSLKYSVITKDAMNFEIPAEVDCIFLFNPFDVAIMGAVVSNIMESAHEHPREIVVAYANPLYINLFLDEGFIEIFHTKEMKYLEAVILKLPAVK
jgi:hypothetical protein